VATAILTLLDDVIVAWSAFDPHEHAHDDCAAFVETLARAEKVLAAARARAAVRAADAGAHLRSGFVDPVDWLARHAGSSAAAAERALNTATRVADLPATKAALGSGELSIDQADEIARTEDDCPGS